MAGGFDYLDEGKSQGGINKKKLSNLQTDQTGLEEAPVDGGEGYIGGNPNASAVGFDYVTGKKGYSKDQPIWSETSTGDDADQGTPDRGPAGSDSTDEKASYKKVDTSEGLPQTWRTSSGAGDAGPANQVSVDTEADLNTEKIGSEMPQTEFTDNEGGGAPKFKHSGS